MDLALAPDCPYPPRDYQVRFLESVFRELETHRSTILVSATGSGKTVLFSHLARLWPGRVLILVHRDTLLWQAREKCMAVCTQDRVEIEQGEYRATRGINHYPLLGKPPRIVIASKDSLYRERRLHSFKRDEFSLIVVDEAHRCIDANQTYSNILKYFSAAKVVGVTATPDRADQKALGCIFESVAARYPMLDAIHDGWLVNVVQQYVHVEGYDISGIKPCKELPTEEVDKIVRQEKVLHGFAEAAIHYSNLQTRWGSGRPTLIFTASVQHAKDLAEIINRRHAKEGIGFAACVYGGMDQQLEREIIQRYRSGEIRYLCNCMKLTEGADFPSTRVVLIARPTKSRCLYEQAVGRGTRPHDSLVPELNVAASAQERKKLILASCKPSVLVIDPVGNSGKHKLISVADVLGGQYDAAVVARAKKRIEEKTGGRGDVDAELRHAAEEIQEEERKRRSEVIVRAKLQTRVIDPFNPGDVTTGQGEMFQTRKPATDKQKEFLRKNGIDESALATMTCTQAQKVIGDIHIRRRFRKCTLGQAKILYKYGLSSHLSFQQARQVLDELSRRGWPPPGSAEARIDVSHYRGESQTG